MTGAVGLPAMGLEAGTRLDRLGVPAGVPRPHPDGIPDPSSYLVNRALPAVRGAIDFGLADRYSQRGVDLVTERKAARVGVGLGGVEPVRHVGIADPMFQVDEAE
jgi:hypothetical protein